MATFTPTANPMVIAASATVISSRPFLAKQIHWVAPATAGNLCTITDLASTPNTLAAAVCTTVSQTATLWPGPAKLTLKGSATQTASWQVTVPNGQLYIWWQ